MNNMNSNTVTNTTTLDFVAEPVAQVYVVKPITQMPIASLPAGYVRLPLGRSDGKKGKSDRAIAVPACSDSVVQLLLASEEGSQWIKDQVDSLRKQVAMKLLKEGAVISSVSLGISALKEALREQPCSTRLTRDAIAQWFAAPDGMKQLLTAAFVARGMRDDAIAATTAAFLATFQKLAARKDNFWLTPQEKQQLEKAMMLLVDDSDYAESAMTESVAAAINEIPTNQPASVIGAL